MIDKIALDLGIYQYAEESLKQYQSRVLYSAIACWIKAITLDRPVGHKEKESTGVSRRHIYERSHAVLETMIKMFPETGEWFDLSADNDDPINLIRARLINHGDLLNIGFETNLALSFVHSNQLTSTVETIYGKTIEDGLLYSGVSTIRYKEAEINGLEKENVKIWFDRFLHDVSWSRDIPDASQMQYYNPRSTTKNNYAAWQDSVASSSDKIILTRMIVNKNSYSYYLLNQNKMLIHRIDPFLQEQGVHIRVMYALRSLSQNNTTVSVACYSNYIRMRLNAILPLQESVLLESYAWPVHRINDKLEWVMGFEVWNYLRSYIEALGILIMEEKHG